MDVQKSGGTQPGLDERALSISSPRATINSARRRQRVDRLAKLLLCVAVVVVVHFHPRWQVEALVGLALLAVCPFSRVRCPGCFGDVSRLPGDGRGWQSQLSRRVQCCPFCGLDFRLEETEASSAEGERSLGPVSQQSASPGQHQTNKSARERINASRWLRWIVHVGGLAATGILGVLLALNDRGVWVLVLAVVAFIGAEVVSWCLPDRCPQCHGKLTGLPDQAWGGLPGLSSQVHWCPFCKMDLNS